MLNFLGAGEMLNVTQGNFARLRVPGPPVIDELHKPSPPQFSHCCHWPHPRVSDHCEDVSAGVVHESLTGCPPDFMLICKTSIVGNVGFISQLCMLLGHPVFTTLQYTIHIPL